MHDLGDFFQKRMGNGYIKNDVSSICFQCGEESNGYHSTEENEMILVCRNNHKVKVPFSFE